MDLDEATGQERLDLQQELSEIEKALGDGDAEEYVADEVVAEWDRQVDRGVKPDLFAGLPPEIRRRMLGGG